MASPVRLRVAQGKTPKEGRKTMSRLYGMTALVATGACLLSSVALAAGAAPAEALEVAAEVGPLTMRLKLVLAFLIVSGIAWLGHRSVSGERAAPANA
jgi:hypothetical protein